MSRINTNVQSLIAQRVLGQNNSDLNNTLERLSTGLRINRGKDDPAGLIASENLKSEITSTNAAIGNAERADQVVNIAEGGLQEVSGLLNELQGLLTTSANTAGLSDTEKEANQLQIDSILQTIDRISSATTFQGTKLLNGNFDYETTDIAAGVNDFQINGAKFEGASLDVNVAITQSAQQGALFLSLGIIGGASTGLDLNGTGTTSNSVFSIEIVGSLGSRELSFSSGQTLTQIVNAINTFTDVTGVEATAVSSATTGGVALRSSEYGSTDFVSVKVTNDADVQVSTGGVANLGVYGFLGSDTSATGIDVAGGETDFSDATQPIRDFGQDVAGTVNGVIGTGDGRQLRVNTDFLDLTLNLDNAGGGTASAVDLGTFKALTIEGGGADFQLAGQVDIGGKVSAGIQDIATRKLGSSDLGFLDELGSGSTFDVTKNDTDFSGAQKIVDQAIDQISSTRGRLGAFQKNVVGATIRNLGVAVENTAAANSVIRDADFAAETASLTRSQILQQASTNSLALANQGPQAVLSLLG
ncbi:MAG: flagellin [Planctomycetota bacterium]